MAFKLNGKPITAISNGSLTEQVSKVASHLPDDELLDVIEMAAKVGHSPEGVSCRSGSFNKSFTTLIRVGTRQRRVFGNAKTIKKLVTALERA